MTALTDFIGIIKGYIDDTNPSDALVTAWVRVAEQRFNDELRVDEMIVRTYATFDDNCCVLPNDWLKTLYVKPKGARRTLTYVSNKDYFDIDPAPTLVQPDPTSPPMWPAHRGGYYTNIGRTMFVWPPIHPDAATKIELAYYAKVPPLSETNAVFDRFPGLYINATLAAATTYLIEDDRLQVFAALATAQIKTANDQATAARFSGSPITPAIRSFG